LILYLFTHGMTLISFTQIKISFFSVLYLQCSLNWEERTRQVRFPFGPDAYLRTLVPEDQREVGADVGEAGEKGQIVRLPLQHCLEVLL
jgi:hypothetical protein